MRRKWSQSPWILTPSVMRDGSRPAPGGAQTRSPTRGHDRSHRRCGASRTSSSHSEKKPMSRGHFKVSRQGLASRSPRTARCRPSRCRRGHEFVTDLRLAAPRLHPQRRSVAMLAGCAPIPASSGQTAHHRLNRQDDRQLNWAIHIVYLQRMRHHQPTETYISRRRAEGKTRREIRRCVKCDIPGELFRILEKPT